MRAMSDVTRILSQIDSGDPAAADQLLPLVYDELRKLAAAMLAHYCTGARGGWQLTPRSQLRQGDFEDQRQAEQRDAGNCRCEGTSVITVLTIGVDDEAAHGATLQNGQAGERRWTLLGSDRKNSHRGCHSDDQPPSLSRLVYASPSGCFCQNRKLFFLLPRASGNPNSRHRDMTAESVRPVLFAAAVGDNSLTASSSHAFHLRSEEAHCRLWDLRIFGSVASLCRLPSHIRQSKKRRILLGDFKPIAHRRQISSRIGWTPSSTRYCGRPFRSGTVTRRGSSPR